MRVKIVFDTNGQTVLLNEDNNNRPIPGWTATAVVSGVHPAFRVSRVHGECHIVVDPADQAPPEP